MALAALAGLFGNKVMAFEDSIDTVWLPEQIAALAPVNQANQQVQQIIDEQAA